MVCLRVVSEEAKSLSDSSMSTRASLRYESTEASGPPRVFLIAVRDVGDESCVVVGGGWYSIFLR